MKESGKTIIFSTHLMEQAEQLCDTICLINRGRKVLGGGLREVRRAFLTAGGERRVALDVETYDGTLDDHTLVKAVTHKPHHVEVTLQDGADSQALLERLVTSGARVHRFELIEPSLNEIFIKSVGDANAQHA
jgi:ABC-2 type transport system ATP-binding protein